MQKKFEVTGMTCSACSATVERVVGKLSGVNSVTVNLLTNTMQVDFDPQVVSDKQISNAVINAGYGVKTENVPATKDKNPIVVRLVVSIVLTLMLSYLSMGHMVGLPIPAFLDGTDNAVTMVIAQLLLCLPVIVINGRYFVVGYKNLFKRSPNMDTLIAVGSTSAFLYGVFALVMMATANGNQQVLEQYRHELYFESSAMILTLITLGKFFEDKCKKRTVDALQKLKNLAPSLATVLVDGKESVVDVSSLRQGDVVVIKQGESVPCDGVIADGNAYFDESAVTGESVAVEKTVGQSVVGGTILLNGYVVITATGVGEQSMLSKIIRLVEDANATKPPIAKIADKVAGIFVTVVMLIALATFVLWMLLNKGFEFALSSAIAVLVISCPCALGLATPVAVMVGTGKGAESGILIKNGDALQNLSKVDVVVFDKTGTLTQGHPQVVQVVGDDQVSLIQVVSSIEAKSNHPLAQAILQYAESIGVQPVEVDDFKNVVGQGVIGTINGKAYFVGNKLLMQSVGIDEKCYVDALTQFANQGKTPLLVATTGKFLGILALADAVTDQAKQVVQQLHDKGIQVVMLTGDNRITAQAVADSLNISQVFAEVFPDGKQQVVATLQQQGKVVAMVGDGINDAPALSQANVGIAVAKGKDVAIDSADVVLVNNNLLDVLDAIRLGKSTITNIKQNLFWAFFYNALAIPLAMGLLYFTPLQIKLDPMMGAFCMSLSSLFVVTNALRLKLFKKTQTTQSTQTKEINMKTVVFEVEGMMCQHCTGRVEKTLLAFSGVTHVSTSLTEKTATVTYQGDVDVTAMVKAVEDQGYPTKVKNS